MKTSNLKDTIGEIPKIIPTGYRVLLIFKLLLERDLTLKELEKQLLLNPEVNQFFTKEAILKYINTLRNSSVEIDRIDNIYKVLDVPFKLNLSHKTIETLIKLEKYTKGLYQHRLYISYNNFIGRLSKYLDKSQNDKIAYLESSSENLFSEYKIHKETIERLEKYICQGLRLEVVTKLNKKIIFDDFYIDYFNKNIYLSGYDQINKEIVSILIENIETMKQLSQMSRKTSLYPSVIYKLKGKLAQSYKLKKNERMINFDTEKQELVIINNREDKNLLFKRLVRYGLLCEVIEPKNIRSEFKEFIKQILNNYQ